MDFNRLVRLYGGEEPANRQLARFEALKEHFIRHFGSADGCELISVRPGAEISSQPSAEPK